MPWKGAVTVSDLRLCLVHQVLSVGRPVAEVCREQGVARKTAYKWLDRFRRGGREGPPGSLAAAPALPASDGPPDRATDRTDP